MNGREGNCELAGPPPVLSLRAAPYSRVLTGLCGEQRASQAARPLGANPAAISMRTALLLSFLYIRILGKMSFGVKKDSIAKRKRKKNSLKTAVLDDFLLNITIGLFTPTAETWLSLASPFLPTEV